MNKKFKKISLLLLLLIVGVILGGTLARYVSTATGDSAIEVAAWEMKIGTTDITGGLTNVADLELVPVGDANIVADKIAPSYTAEAAFTINPAGTEVSFVYTIELGAIASVAGPVPANLTIGSVTYWMDGMSDDAALTETALGSGIYKGEVRLTSRAALTSDEAVDITIKAVWADLNTTSANANDTAAGTFPSELTIPVKVTVSQLVE